MMFFVTFAYHELTRETLPLGYPRGFTGTVTWHPETELAPLSDNKTKTATRKKKLTMSTWWIKHKQN